MKLLDCLNSRSFSYRELLREKAKPSKLASEFTVYNVHKLKLKVLTDNALLNLMPKDDVESSPDQPVTSIRWLRDSSCSGKADNQSSYFLR